MTAAATIVLVAIPTVLIPNPWFAREIPPTAWSWPVLIVTGVLAGLVAATYVARKDGDSKERGGVLGTAGASGAFFAAGSIALLAVALVMRVRRERSCPIPPRREAKTPATA